MKAVRVAKASGNNVLKALRKNGWLDNSRNVIRSDTNIELPVKDVFNYNTFIVTLPNELIDNIEVITQDEPKFKITIKPPFDEIVKRCKIDLKLTKQQLELLPNKWELLGNALILNLPGELKKHWREIARVYAKTLRAELVLRRAGKVCGIYREPGAELLVGNKKEIIHLENKIKFKFNPLEIMFSSGNIDERIRISTLAKANETVVDMFSGIGYFCLPMAVHSKPAKIIACELNPNAFHYLCENIKLNHVEEIVQPLLGDNRECIPKGIADRIVMGYIKSDNTHRTAALGILKPTGGWIHYHHVGFKNNAVESAFDKVQESLTNSMFNEHFDAEVENQYIIKSYGPKLVHLVLDIRLEHNA